MPLCNASALECDRWAIIDAREKVRGESPRARWGHSMHVLASNGQSARARVLLSFGGEVLYPGPLASTRTDELWSFDQHMRWRLLHPSSAVSPSARRLHAATVIDGGDTLLLSGGLGRDGWPIPELWTLKLNSSSASGGAAPAQAELSAAWSVAPSALPIRALVGER